MLKALKKLYFKEMFIDVRRMLLFMFKQVFLTMDNIWSIYNAHIQCTVGGTEEAKRQRQIFMFKCLLSCHTICILLHKCPFLLDLVRGHMSHQDDT